MLEGHIPGIGATVDEVDVTSLPGALCELVRRVACRLMERSNVGCLQGSSRGLAVDAWERGRRCGKRMQEEEQNLHLGYSDGRKGRARLGAGRVVRAWTF